MERGNGNSVIVTWERRGAGSKDHLMERESASCIDNYNLYANFIDVAGLQVIETVTNLNDSILSVHQITT